MIVDFFMQAQAAVPFLVDTVVQLFQGHGFLVSVFVPGSPQATALNHVRNRALVVTAKVTAAAAKVAGQKGIAVSTAIASRAKKAAQARRLRRQFAKQMKQYAKLAKQTASLPGHELTHVA